MTVFRSLKPSLVGGILSPALYGRVDLEKYHTGVRDALNAMVMPHGGMRNRAGTVQIAELKDSTSSATLIPFSFNTEQNYILELGDNYMRVIKDGGQVLDAAEAITGVSTTNPVTITSPGHTRTDGTEIYIDDVGGTVELNDRNYVVRNVTASTYDLEDLFGNAVDGTGFTAYTIGGVSSRIYETVAPYLAADTQEVVYAQEADVMYLANNSYPFNKLSRTGHAAWTFTVPDFTPDTVAPANIVATVDTGTGSEDYTYTVATIDGDTAEESLPGASSTIQNDLLIAGNKNNIAWDPVPGAKRYVVYKEDNGVFGYIGGTTGLEFTDENIVPDLADTPQEANNPFLGAGNYPACVTYFEQRLWAAGSQNNPQEAHASQSAGNYENFGRSSPAKDSDAIQFTIKARQVNAILAMVPFSDLIFMTSGAEFSVTAPDSPGFLTPSNPIVRPQGYRGSSVLQPILVGKTMLYNYARGGVIRDYGYDFSSDSYTGNDLTILARHLFEGKALKAWSYQQVPDSVIWVVTDDGLLYSLTYMREHEIWAWTRHESAGGLFESVATIGGVTEDETYFVVKRTINGVTKRFIERLNTRLFPTLEDSFFVDCGKSYNGVATDTVFIPHLEGETVWALVDGNAVKNLTVGARGEVTLPIEGTRIHVGLPLMSKITTLDIDLGQLQGLGTVQGRSVAVPEVTLRLFETRGIEVGDADGNTEQWPQREDEDWNEPTALFSGDKTLAMPDGWTTGGRVTIEQNNPLPFTILSIMPNVVWGE